MKSKRQLASTIAHIEGKKSQARIGDIMEILTIMEKIFAETRVGVEGISDGYEYAMSERVTKLARKMLKVKENIKKVKSVKPISKEI